MQFYLGMFPIVSIAEANMQFWGPSTIHVERDEHVPTSISHWVFIKPFVSVLDQCPTKPPKPQPATATPFLQSTFSLAPHSTDNGEPGLVEKSLSATRLESAQQSTWVPWGKSVSGRLSYAIDTATKPRITMFHSITWGGRADPQYVVVDNYHNLVLCSYRGDTDCAE